MGIINTTPDSFSDGGQYQDQKNALKQAQELIKQGANIIDIGGESTRPGANPVSITDELKRTIPVIQELSSTWNGLISIDTTKSEVAATAIEAGAHIINDISAMEEDPKMIKVAADTQASCIIMHRQGSPQTMQQNPKYDNVVDTIIDYFEKRLSVLTQAGIPKETISIDPGIGFGKSLEHNLEILKRCDEFLQLDCPITMGLSRKSFIPMVIPEAHLTEPKNRDSLTASLSAHTYNKGARIHRVHNVALCRDTLKMSAAISSKL